MLLCETSKSHKKLAYQRFACSPVDESLMDKIASRLFCSLVAFILVLPVNVGAFDELNEPQTLIYDTDHLGKTKEGSSIIYTYERTQNDAEPLSDEVILSIKKSREDARRDVSVNFLSGDIKLHLPDFDNYRGNPVIIGMLEHVAQSMGYDTGGGALYFRNRIRDQLASKHVTVNRRSDSAVMADQSIAVAEFSFAPLKNDPYVGDNPELTEATITLTFSEEIPGYLVSIAYVSGPGNKPETTRTLKFSGVQ